MRAIWRGSIKFGLVFIPVSVYPATREETVSFKQLRATDLSPIKYKKVAEVDQKEVPASDIVKGYEYEKGKWVTLKDKTSRRLGSSPPTRSKSRTLSSKARSIPNFTTSPISSKRRRAVRKPTRYCTRP